MVSYDTMYFGYTPIPANNNKEVKQPPRDLPVLPYTARSLFVQQLDIIVKRHLAELSLARDKTNIESSQRAILDSYIKNAIDFVNTWSNSFLISAMLSGEELKNLWAELREKNDYTISFIFKVLNEIKMLYTQDEFVDLVKLISSSFTVFYKEPNVKDLVMDEKAASKFITSERLFNILMEDQWLIVFLGITLLDFIHD